MAVNDIGPRIGIDGEAEFKKSIAAVNAQMRALGAEMKAVTAEFAANADSEDALSAKNAVLAKSVSVAQTAISTLGGQLDRQKKKLSELGAELDRAAAEFGENSKEAAKAQNAYNQQYAYVARLEKQYNDARTSLANFNNELAGVADAASVANQALSAQDVLAGVGAWDAIKTAVNAASDALRDAVQTGMAFNSSMADVAATMGTSVSALGELRGFALEMGESTVFSANQAAQALNYMALAGYDAQTSMDTLPNVLNQAAAGGLELASASDMVTDAQSALGLSMEQTAILVDEMAKTSTRTNTSVGQLGEAILTVGGTAKFMAGGTAELNQVLGLLADNSIKGAEGGTKLRNIILSLTSPTDKAAATLEQLGVSAFDAEGQMRQFSDVFPELQRALSTLTAQEQIDALSQIFNSQDIAAAQALLGTTTERWNELSAAIAGASGSAEQMAETRLDNLAGDLTLMQSAAEGAKIAFSDSLTPALRDVAQMGTGIITFVGDAVKEFPALGSAVAGATAGIGALTLGMGAMSAASALGVTSIGALTGAVLASPVAPFALAIGGITAAFTAFHREADQAKTANDEFLESLDETRARLAENTEAAADSADELRAQADALLLLAESGELNAAQQQAMLNMIQELNAAVPGLNLAYDEQTGKLNMTAEAVENLIEAEARRLVANEGAKAYSELLVQQMDIARQLEEAEAALEEARAKNAAAMERETVNGQNVIRLNSELASAQSEAAMRVGELQSQYDSLGLAMEEILAEYGDVASGADDAASSVDNLSDSIQGAGDSAGEAVSTIAELEEATLYASGAADSLSEALKEQEKEGSLSLQTTNELIEAGYGAALAIDTENGSISLNRELYIQLAKAKIDEQLATLEAAKAAVKAKAAAQDEMMQVAGTAEAYFKAAEAKKAYEGDVVSYEAQIAALQAAKNGLTSYGNAAATAARRSSGASKQIKTQAQKDLEEYKTLKAELDHEKNMGVASEADYYRRLGELRDRYLTDAGNLDEYRKVSETIYKADQKALQEREKLWRSASDEIIKLESEFQEKLSQRAEQIVDSYKLFDEVPAYQKASGAELISNLENQIAAIESFYDNVAQLEERGVSAALVEEIRGMGVKASGELSGLLELTDEQLGRYSDLFGEKQELANRLATDELKNLRLDTDQAIMEQLDSVGKLYEENGPELGLSFAQNLADGMELGQPMVDAMAANLAESAMAAFASAYNRDVEAIMAQSKLRVTSGDIGELLAGAVNGINTGGGGGVYPAVDVTLTLDGDVLARKQVDPMRQAFRERPETLDDT